MFLLEEYLPSSVVVSFCFWSDLLWELKRTKHSWVRSLNQGFKFTKSVISSSVWIWQAFRKEVIFIIDISGSMKGGPFESAKNGLLSSLQKLNPEDSFNIIAFKMDTYLFSSVMEQATEEAIIEATRWLNDKLTADGGTNILGPLKQVFLMFHCVSFQTSWYCGWHIVLMSFKSSSQLVCENKLANYSLYSAGLHLYK